MRKQFDSKKYFEEQKMIQLKRRVEKEMLEKHRIAYGPFGHPDGSYDQWCDSRREFYHLAKKLDIITEDQYNQIYRDCARIWDYSLSE